MEQEDKTTVMGSQADPLMQMLGKRIVVIASSKSGSGQTSTIFNLAMKLVEDDKKVLILDTTDEPPSTIYALSNPPLLTLKHALTDESVTVEEAVVSSEYGVDFLKSGDFHLVEGEQIAEDYIEKLKWQSKNLQNMYGVILVDVGVLYSSLSLRIAFVAPEAVIIVSPDVPSRVCSYMTIKHIAQHKTDNSFIRLLVNMATDEMQAQQIAEGVQVTSEKFLNESLVNIEYLGYIPLDMNIINAFYNQKPFVSLYPDTPASLSITSIAQKIYNEKTADAKTTILGEILVNALSAENLTNNMEE